MDRKIAWRWILSDMLWQLSVVVIVGALVLGGYLIGKGLTGTPRLRAAALLAYMLALSGGYVGLAWLALLAWNNRQPYWVSVSKPVEFFVQSFGTLALFCGIFVVPILLGLVIWRFVVLVRVLLKPESKTPGYR